MTDPPQLKRSHLTPTALSQYLALDNCDRYLRFYLYKGETDRLVKRLSHESNLTGTGWLPVQPLSGLLEDLGNRTEQAAVDALQAQGYAVRDLAQFDSQTVLPVLAGLRQQPAPLYLYQLPVRGRLGRWLFEGRADLIQVAFDRATGRLKVLVMDVKASRKDKVQHRLQVAVYVRLLEEMLAQVELTADFGGAIIRRETDGRLQDPASVTPFELEPYLSTVRYLTEGEASPLERVDAAPDLDSLHYYLGPRCDGCSYSPVCLTQSAERQDLALVPFLDSSDKRILNAAGITDLAALAGLKQFGMPEVAAEENQPDYATAPLSPPSVRPRTHLITAPGQEALVENLSRRWPLAARLDRLIQRAARASRHFDKTTPARRYFLDRTPRRMRSNLPDDKLYPDLLKIFLDVQYDYLEDRIYLAGALVQGFGRERSVVHLCQDVPDDSAERVFLLEWVGALLVAVAEVAGEVEAAPLHLYFYNRRDQKVLLDALRRHLDGLVALPALYQLLTDTPALTQPALAFLYDEVNERLNLVGPLASLQVVSRQLGFNWTDSNGHNFARLFRAGLFDYGLRRNDGVFIHSSARFHSNLPLEYAYAIWGRLPGPPGGQYRRADRLQLEAFQAHRLRALAHIEASFTYKNSYLVKTPVRLAGLLDPPERSVQSGDLALVLEQFLLIEQYTNLQQHLELFARPIIKRVEQGQALLVRCTEIDATTVGLGSYRKRKLLHATFLAEFDQVGMHPQIALEISKLKEGDFVTLNLLERDGQPWQIVGGRLARIEEITGEWIKLELSGSSLGQNQHSAFRYYHERDLLPQPGQYYMIDPMVDNLNGDKLQDACRHAGQNRLYKLALSGPVIAVEEMAESKAAQYFAELVQQVETEAGRPLNQDQLAVICGPLNSPLRLVQGPPGTGKSHTLGWAVLTRLYVALSQPKSPDEASTLETCRVIVSSQTHNAVEIVLESIAGKWQQLQAAAPTDERTQCFKEFQIFKAGGQPKPEQSAAGIGFIDPWEKDQIKAALDGPATALVIGATPGNLYNLMKHYYGLGRRGKGKVAEPLFWQHQFFDLLVLDEASQMNLPHAVLAAGWLKPAAPVLIVGDHRQLAPILAHGWEHEEHLPTVHARPYRSVFQYFLEAGWERVALSESFRLHRVQAEFLQDNIYRHDGITFHSRRTRQLPALTDPANSLYLRAVLDPAYPLVVIEHNEAGSQQYNPVEVELISPLIAAATAQLGLDGLTGIGIVVPHRAQKAVLQNRFPVLARAGAIDTVERFQGGERDLIIVSATASDPDYIAGESEFLLNPNRFNVALSRPRCKLIVLASSSIFQFISARLELYEQALLWKRLAAVCQAEILWQGVPPLKTLPLIQPPLNIRVYGKKA